MRVTKKTKVNINNRVEAVNILNKHINYITPLILDILKSDFALKKDYSLTKKCNDKISKYLKFINKHNKTISTYIDTERGYYGVMHCKISFSTECGNYSEYAEQSVYLWDNEKDLMTGIITDTKLLDFKPFKIKTLKSVLNAINKTNKMIDKINALNDKISENEKGFYNYFNK
ncbi:MAG: hypothetical protein GOVbin212_42 [Prokaryotic dsDNA virus sp.]|nr:MAG: hypothetical protein GOVbin212_42 [Prokaryotic dsDNA virus sp.]|tara:strand:- start:19900 stop:20418 length:519 start_codon:yes stop_codon:yes gene_type:complete